MKQVAIAKIIKIPDELPYDITEREIDDAKKWCRECIKLRLDLDNIDGNLDEIEYIISRFPDDNWQPQIGYKIEARLNI